MFFSGVGWTCWTTAYRCFYKAGAIVVQSGYTFQTPDLDFSVHLLTDSECHKNHLKLSMCEDSSSTKLSDKESPKKYMNID